MLTRFTEFDRTLSVWDELRRKLDGVWEEFESPDERSLSPAYSHRAWPKVNASDAGATLVLRAEVPGLTDKDVNVTLTGSGLTIAGERKITPPDGYSVQRQERPVARFSRSWTFPYKVDAENTTATVKDGVLTVTVPKVPEAQPRQIAVRASA
jgi:HSP20 family protein